MTNSGPPPTRPTSRLSDVNYGVRKSRRLLIDTMRALSEFGEAVTVVGAHAVHEWVQAASGSTRLPDASSSPIEDWTMPLGWARGVAMGFASRG
ncbi:MAG: hypothetical protein LBK95_20195 [Bifidobacteriaceae bacterium]|jgi:hypothetical protein|nr:hypothetical protein [Bifidobacteriaceae bacterium]